MESEHHAVGMNHVAHLGLAVAARAQVGIAAQDALAEISDLGSRLGVVRAAAPERLPMASDAWSVQGANEDPETREFQGEGHGVHVAPMREK